MVELTGKGKEMVEAVDYVRTSNKNGVAISQFDKSLVATVLYALEKSPDKVSSIIEFAPRNPEFYGDEKDRYKSSVANTNIFIEENLSNNRVQQVDNVVNISDQFISMPENIIESPQQVSNVVNISSIANALPNNIVEFPEQDMQMAVGENIGGRRM